MGKVTIEQVAARAEVSTATVSKALRGLPVSPEARAKVVAAAQELGWQPNLSASRLASSSDRTGVVGLIMAFYGLWYDAEILAGVEAATAAAEFDLLVFTTRSLALTTNPLGPMARVAQRVDGLVLMDFAGAAEDDLTATTATTATPAVAVGGVIPAVPSFAVDDRAATTAAVNHLLALGHERIGLVAGSPTPPYFSAATERRRQGYHDAITSAGLLVDPDLEAPGGFTIDGGRRAMELLLTRRPRPTAVFSMSDEMALGASIAAQRAGLAIPGDLSIVGFDDHPVAFALELTTIRQPIGTMVDRAVSTLLAVIASPASARSAGIEVMDGELVVRRSTAPPHG